MSYKNDAVLYANINGKQKYAVLQICDNRINHRKEKPISKRFIPSISHYLRICKDNTLSTLTVF